MPPPKGADLSAAALRSPLEVPRPVQQTSSAGIGMVNEDFRNESVLELVPSTHIAREGEGWMPGQDPPLPLGDMPVDHSNPLEDAEEATVDVFYWG